MSDIQDAYVAAILADATYVNLFSKMNSGAITTALERRMTLTQAEFIAANFEGKKR